MDKLVSHISAMSRGNWCGSDKSWEDQLKYSLKSSNEGYIIKANTSAKIAVTTKEHFCSMYSNPINHQV